MNGFLIDTNVVSEFSRTGGPDQRVKSWLKSIPAASLYVSVLTLAEIRRGIELRELGKRRTQLEEWLRDELLPSFDESRVLPITKAVADRWAILSARATERGTPIAVIDGLLAATALEHDLTIATRDRDFAGLGVLIFNPWEV